MTTNTFDPMHGDGGRTGNRWRAAIWGGAACVLLLPLVAMQLDAPGVHWTLSDFVVMGVLLAVACGLYELGAWLSGNFRYRLGFAVAVATGFLTVWVNLAVGMIGSEDNPGNFAFAGVLAIAAIGAAASRWRPRGLALAMTATALAQGAAAIHAAVADGPYIGFLVACFAGPWLVAAALFLGAARTQAGAR